jgi:solute carrier family 35 (UDP-sugar transporter), member A1/2/3
LSNRVRNHADRIEDKKDEDITEKHRTTMGSESTGGHLKWIALLALLVQNSGLILTMRYSRISRPADQMYIATTAVLVAEMLKLVVSSLLCFSLDCKYDIQRFRDLLRVEFVDGRREFLKLFIPSGLYVIQNNLQYIGTSNLPAEIFQVLSNMKIVTTAILSVLMLSKKLTGLQWISIMALTFGVGLVQMSQGKGSGEIDNQNQLLGLICVLSACCTSGFAGVYFEKVLKSTNSSIWLRNIQLAIIGLGFSSLTCVASDYEKIQQFGFFFGYDYVVCVVIFLAALGGLVVAVVVKYADNVLKGFAASASLVLSTVVSNLFFHDSSISFGFVVGATIVCGSAYSYSYTPPVVPSNSPGDKSEESQAPLLSSQEQQQSKL